MLILNFFTIYKNELLYSLRLYTPAWRSAGTSAPGAWSPCGDTLRLIAGAGKTCLTDERLSAVLRRAGSDLKCLVVRGSGYTVFGNPATIVAVANPITGAGVVDHVECFLEATARAASEVMLHGGVDIGDPGRVIKPALWQLESLDLRCNPALQGGAVQIESR